MNTASEKLSDAFSLSGKPDNKKVQNNKNADHNGHIVIAENSKSHTDCIHPTVSVIDQLLNTHKNDRKQDNAVQPHHIPVISDAESTKGIKRCKHNRRIIISSGSSPQIAISRPS